MKNKSKFKNQLYHSKLRSIERLGIQLTNQDILNMINKLKQGKSLFIESQSRSRSKHIIYYNNVDFVVIYDKTRKMFNTILDVSYLNKIDKEKYDKWVMSGRPEYLVI